MSAGAAGSRPAPVTRISARASALLVVVLAAGALSIAPLQAYMDARHRVTELERQAASMQAKNERLAAHVLRLNDPIYLERLARACLGMVEPGEIAFVAVPRKGAPSTPDC